MSNSHIDLDYLGRLYKGDAVRIGNWIAIYLDEAPDQFIKLSASVSAGDVEGLLAAAHDLRPQAHYIGASRMLELLLAIGERARVNGSLACAVLVKELIHEADLVNAELAAWITPPWTTA